MAPVYLFVIAAIVVLLARAIKVLKEYERGVIFRLGRVLGSPKGPGLILPGEELHYCIPLPIDDKVKQ